MNDDGQRAIVPATNRHSGWRRSAAVALAVAFGATLIGAAAIWWADRSRQIGATSRAARFLLVGPEGQLIAPGTYAPVFAISPDGTKIVVRAADSFGKSSLWLRPLSSLSSQRIEHTEGAGLPFWSPDSQSIAFQAGGRLQRVLVTGGVSQPICECSSGSGTWNRNGVIIFRDLAQNVLRRVPETGGTPVAITTLDEAGGELFHSSPYFLPDGRHFIYISTNQYSRNQQMASDFSSTKSSPKSPNSSTSS